MTTDELRERVAPLFDRYESATRAKEEAIDEIEEVRHLIKTAMEAAGVQKMRVGNRNASVTPGKMGRRVDTAALKRDGIYEKYSEEVYRDSSLRMTTSMT